MSIDLKGRQKRIFEIAKELNISHSDIMKYLEKEGIPCKSIMTPVDEACYMKILEEFAKEKDIVERIRKERARREAENKRKADEEARRSAELERRKLEEEVFRSALSFYDEAVKNVLKHSLNVQRELIEAVWETGKVTDVSPESVKLKKPSKAPEAAPEKTSVASTTEPLKKKEKKKLRRIKIDELEPRLDQKFGKRKPSEIEEEKNRRLKRPGTNWATSDRLVDAQIRKTMAKIGEKSTRKKYKKAEAVSEELETSKKIRISDFATVDTLASMMGVDAADVIQKCMELGSFVTMNQRLDFDTITLLSDEFGFEVEKLEQYGEEKIKIEDTEEDLENASPRPPVVVIMGHVDHGKTSLLDYIRRSNIVAGESGGITQHIGAYRVELPSKKAITFLDTPGHEAFTAMRARGAQVTDLVILIVAADDSVMPQTIEAINHAKAANVPIVVAINKIDKPEADVERVRRDLANHDVLVESWGGKIQTAEISAKTGKGIDHLLDLILLEAEMLELKANYQTMAKGTVIESSIDKRRGPIATVIIKKGTLKVGDPFVCGVACGRVRTITDERGQKLAKAEPSDPVVISGFDFLPKPAEVFAVVKDEREARKIASERQKIEHEHQKRQVKEWSLDAISAQIAEGKIKQLNVILKGDFDGSVEAVAQTLQELGNEEVAVSIKHKAAGNITESDILLAKTSQAVVIGFNVTADPKVNDLAKKENVEIRHYSIIYELTEDVQAALEGLLTPDKIEEHLGEAEVREVFKIPRAGLIAGSYVVEGKVVRNAQARLKRDGEIIFEGPVESLKRFKDDVREVNEGYECGIALQGAPEYSVGDRIEFFEIKSVKRTLA
ncbi:MAG: translation initiation factor IF-2 [Candidatus Marinimicrobia bacterium]|jgi:translation initiation factor IF-2|nr:translation initiation factor IF-2 [Candidatus Neomarinimicrobiota bacterium]MCK9482957.1 translation initiation factor IF-2 [Candidatus Neomarinimicrobiota bacterium]MCK9559020.1 translation initiation factor IF-2 [Candidatus Neomarinimicrobiota bacterium]MDD5061341.1 translation initiation factor IF-2 [Candidatus Neomarinimicrobiota bacterium]MDD5229961.1 translation initiation factor IF-2 [Candidatus Neomarinimicrobiota bacterium]